jgi:hydroxymethylbilane synthase
MYLAAIGPRADPRDAFCSERYPSIDDLPAGALVGTSSPRRRAQLQALRPDLRFETIRGNVETRLRKLREGGYDAILLAMAGLQRLELAATFTVPLEPDVLIPAVGQGALAIETRAADRDLAGRIAAIFTDPHTDLAVRAERAFLRTLRGGCQAPVGAHATVADGELTLHAAIAAVDGSKIVRGRETIPLSGVAAAESMGESLARRLLAEGGEAILVAAADFVEPAAVGALAASDIVPFAESGRVGASEMTDTVGALEATDTIGAFEASDTVGVFPASDAAGAFAASEVMERVIASEPVGLAGPLSGRLFLLPRTQERPSSIAPALRPRWRSAAARPRRCSFRRAVPYAPWMRF